MLRSTIGSLLVVAAVAILIANIWIPVLQITGTSMAPTLKEGEVVLCLKNSNYSAGDLVAFYYGNKVLVKRYIAGPGDVVDIADDGTVSVNGVELNEPYVSELALGETDLNYPYQVPESRYFVMGDHRSVSMDSRLSQIGCIADEQMIGKLILRVWPLSGIGNPDK
jgi:signal peptidase I